MVHSQYTVYFAEKTDVSERLLCMYLRCKYTGALRLIQQHFTHSTATDIVEGGNQLVPGISPWPLGGYCKAFPHTGEKKITMSWAGTQNHCGDAAVSLY